MNGAQKFFICKHCGNMVKLINNKGVPMVCCGEKMAEIVPNSVDASNEKHLPVVTVLDDSLNIEVGSITHPMQDDHHISFVYVETEQGSQCKRLRVGEEPTCVFRFLNDNPVAVFAYCNLHGLWKTEI